jgi:anthranilate synthase/aminodeoxychorismate synthase-like glutamine amidotransferase
MQRILILDNFDSFTYNVKHLLETFPVAVTVRRADALNLAEVGALAPELIVISPGPGRPEEAALALEVVRAWAGRVPIFGICLGMQVMVTAFGGRVEPSAEPIHGKTSPVRHDGQGLFDGLPNPVRVARYHSLRVTETPPVFDVAATDPGGTPMSLRHRSLPLAGVQFHPESFLTEHGREMMAHVLSGRM